MEKFKFSKSQVIGIFVLLTLIAVFVVINFLKGQDIFNRNVKYFTVFKNVEGLTATSPIYIRGLKVGSVEDIEYNNVKDVFVLRISVKSDYAIPSNSVAELYSSDIMGGKAVRIELGDANTHLESKDTIKGVFIPDMITMLSSEIMPLKEMASELLGNMNKTINNINTLFDSTSVDNLKNSIEKFNRTMSNAQKLSDALAKSSPELEEMLANLNILSGSLKDGAGDIKSSLSNINQITTTLSEAELEATIENLKNLIAKMQDPNGTIGKLLTTEDMHNSLNTLLKDVDILVNKISENPKKYIKISVF